MDINPVCLHFNQRLLHPIHRPTEKADSQLLTKGMYYRLVRTDPLNQQRHTKSLVFSPTQSHFRHLSHPSQTVDARLIIFYSFRHALAWTFSKSQFTHQ